MTDVISPVPRARIAPVGLMFLAITSFGWGINWPVMKHLLMQWPPLSARGLCGVCGALLLASLACTRGQSLYVARAQWPRLLLLSFLNVTCWMALLGLALLWLPASEAAVLAATVPVWAILMARVVLGEALSWKRVAAMLMALAGVAVLMGGNGFSASLDKLPGIALTLVGAFGFALGSVMAKRLPLPLPLIPAAAWQIGLGCLPVALAGLVFENARFATLDTAGWTMIGYLVVVQFCISYLCWFGALARLPASVATIGTLAVPVIGVIASAVSLGEPLGLVKIAALALTLGGVVLATRS